MHPGQVGIVNAAYGTLGDRELAYQTAIAEGFEGALADGVASIRVGGTFVDYPVYAGALEMVRRHYMSTSETT